jgi:hypothetical protein
MAGSSAVSFLFFFLSFIKSIATGADAANIKLNHDGQMPCILTGPRPNNAYEIGPSLSSYYTGIPADRIWG